ncbi:hypothetical protein [Bacillus sp. 2SH]|nr:hypothetical protein [Bacillus sp. 2SH]
MNLHNIGIAESQKQLDEHTSREGCFFITNLPLGIHLFSQFVRQH